MFGDVKELIRISLFFHKPLINVTFLKNNLLELYLVITLIRNFILSV